MMASGDGGQEIDLYAEDEDFQTEYDPNPQDDLYDDVIAPVTTTKPGIQVKKTSSPSPSSSPSQSSFDHHVPNKPQIIAPSNHPKSGSTPSLSQVTGHLTTGRDEEKHHSDNKKSSVYVGNLQWWTTDLDLIAAINSVGIDDVIDIKFYENRGNGQSKGFCVVNLGSESSFRNIIEKLPKVNLNGNNPMVTVCNRLSLNHFELQNKKNNPSQESRNNNNSNNSNNNTNNSNNNGMNPGLNLGPHPGVSPMNNSNGMHAPMGIPMVPTSTINPQLMPMNPMGQGPSLIGPGPRPNFNPKMPGIRPPLIMRQPRPGLALLPGPHTLPLPLPHPPPHHIRPHHNSTPSFNSNSSVPTSSNSAPSPGGYQGNRPPLMGQTSLPPPRMPLMVQRHGPRPMGNIGGGLLRPPTDIAPRMSNVHPHPNSHPQAHPNSHPQPHGHWEEGHHQSGGGGSGGGGGGGHSFPLNAGGSSRVGHGPSGGPSNVHLNPAFINNQGGSGQGGGGGDPFYRASGSGSDRDRDRGSYSHGGESHGRSHSYGNGPSRDKEWEELIEKNKNVAKTSIDRAIREASCGNITYAIDTLQTVIGLISSSRVGSDDRNKVTVSSLEDTLNSINNQALRGRRERHRSRSPPPHKRERRDRSSGRSRSRSYRSRDRERERDRYPDRDRYHDDHRDKYRDRERDREPRESHRRH